LIQIPALFLYQSFFANEGMTAATKTTMKKYLLFLIPAMLIGLTAAIGLTSCGSDDEPSPESTTNGSADLLMGSIWEGVSTDAWGFIKFDNDNNCTYYEDKYIQGVGKVIYVYKGYYTVDSSGNYMILHFSYLRPNSDADIYRINRLTDSELSFTWLDDVKDRYHSDTYSLNIDLAIIQQFSEQPIPGDPEDKENYARSTDDRLQTLLDSADSIRK